jgi:hypothetical protein
MNQGAKKKISLWAVILVSALLAAFICFSSAFSDIFERSLASVKGTEWLSFESGKIAFAEKTGVWSRSDGVLDFGYSEAQGIVTLKISGQTSDEYLVRSGGSEMASPDGREIFYLYVPKASNPSGE